MQLSKHFKLSEFTFSQTAARKGIRNIPSSAAIDNLKDLCDRILEPARAQFGALRITSGYRSPELNAAIGGARNSAHTRGWAADVVPVVAPKLEFAKWVARNCTYDQIILEFGTIQNPSWIHISAEPTNRMQILSAQGTPVRYQSVIL